MKNNFHEAQSKGKTFQFTFWIIPTTITMLKTTKLSKNEFSVLLNTFNKCLLSGYYVPDTVLTTENMK